MKLNLRYLLAAAIGLAFSAIGAQAQLNVDLHSQALFGPFIGGTDNHVTPPTNPMHPYWDDTVTITTGTPTAAPFNIVYQPTVGVQPTINNPTDSLVTSTFTFNSTITPLNYFASLATVINYDFDNDGTTDLTQGYTINLSSFVAPNGFTGVNYQIIPVQFFGNVTINGVLYNYASVVSGSFGTLFDSQSAVAAIQFQFSAVPVPEPSTYAAFGVAALGGIVWLRRRRSSLTGLAALRS